MFHVDVFDMQSGFDNLFRNNGPAIFSFDVEPVLNNGIFTLTASGVYSIELTVIDWAGRLC